MHVISGVFDISAKQFFIDCNLSDEAFRRH